MYLTSPSISSSLNLNQKFRSVLVYAIAAIFVLSISACSTQEFSSHKKPRPSAELDKRSAEGVFYDDSQLQKDTAADESQKQAPFAPWQTWNNGLTLKRMEFKDARVASADSLLSKSDFSGARTAYRSARVSGADELESLALRLASLELLSGDSPRAVMSLSKFFQTRKQQETQISDDSALFFGYAYGQSRNYEQALAWFSQALRSTQAFIRERSSIGIRALLRIIPNSSFEEMSYLWKSNEAISALISEERAIRQSRPAVILQNFAFFWTISEVAASSENQQLSGDSLNNKLFSNLPTRKVAVLLPLSGRFVKMGESIRKGLELAAELSVSRGTPLELSFRDFSKNSGEETQPAPVSDGSVVDELAAQGTGVIVGPLISERTAEVAESARRNSIPAILLAKGGNASLGEGIYRFGLTNESQANSLISAIMRYRSNPRIALVYPNDESGLGFNSAIQSALNRYNIKAIYDYQYQKGNSAEMLGHASAIEINPPEFVIFGDNLKAAVQFFSALSPAARKAIIPVGSALWDNPIEVMQSKTILSGAIFVSPFYPDLSKPLVSEFVARFEEKNGRTPDFFAAQGYDVGLLLASSANAAEATYSPPLQLEGITGNAQTTSYGEIIRDLAVLRLAHGTIGPLTEIPAPRPISVAEQEPEAVNSDSGSLDLPPSENSDPTIGQ